MVADLLAKNSTLNVQGFCYLYEPPAIVTETLLDDIVGVTSSRSFKTVILVWANPNKRLLKVSVPPAKFIHFSATLFDFWSTKMADEVTELPHLPMEIIREILAWLPVKPLCRFRCVSKSWNSLTFDPKFVKMHFNKALEHEDVLYQRRRVLVSDFYSGEFYSFSLDEFLNSDDIDNVGGDDESHELLVTEVSRVGNVGAEEVREIPLPPCCHIEGDDFYLSVFRDCLCVILGSGEDVWVMKEYGVRESWTKIRISIPPCEWLHSGFRKKSYDLLLLEDHDNRASFHPITLASPIDDLKNGTDVDSKGGSVFTLGNELQDSRIFWCSCIYAPSLWCKAACFSLSAFSEL
ncbi:hypothetical protein ACLB2K_021578 [Fragaria x ananassa]